MQEIKCPNCGEVFTVDESGYQQIVSQVRDREFNNEVSRRVESIEQKMDSERKLLEMEKAKEKADAVAKLEKEIEELKAKVESADLEKKLALSEATSEKDRRIAKLEGDLSLKEKEMELNETSLKENHKAELKLRDEEIERLKDFKARQSTKMIGESLEQHCQNQFNSIRMTAFPTAYFEKDNDARTGSKGDFIFRDYADGMEYISIMFEMKNEMDTTATKHKNEDFFKELDKDRREKGCEYAVLVSLLESDSELYNTGIVDVSYRYEKMYVIRPQFFIPLITLLKNAARNTVEVKRELAVVKNQQVDIMNFEENMNNFREAFGKNYELSEKRFNDAIDEIDKAIKNLEKVKEALQSSTRNLRLANDKVQDLSIKKLTKNAPSVRALFDEIGKN